jgi:hypothetical protein
VEDGDVGAGDMEVGGGICVDVDVGCVGGAGKDMLLVKRVDVDPCILRSTLIR